MGNALQRRPDLFIVGAPKAGTTSLYSYLREHPDVFMSDMKEPMYFSPDVYRSWRQKFQFGRDPEERYLELFAAAGDRKRVGEASTHYMSSPLAPSLIHRFQPDAHIICMLREPVDMTYAWHGERVFRGVERSASLSLALLDDESGAVYFEIGRYGTQLARWFEEFGRDRVHVIVFDDFIADTAGEFRRVLEFLEVDSSFQPSSFGAYNAATGKSRLVPLLRTRPARVAAQVIRRVIGGQRSRRLSRGIRTNEALQRREPRPPLAPEVRQRLAIAYDEEVRLCGELLGRNLREIWSKPPPDGSASSSKPDRSG